MNVTEDIEVSKHLSAGLIEWDDEINIVDQMNLHHPETLNRLLNYQIRIFIIMMAFGGAAPEKFVETKSFSDIQEPSINRNKLEPLFYPWWI